MLSLCMDLGDVMCPNSFVYFWHYINCLFAYLASLITFFLLIYFLIHLLPYLSVPSRIGLFYFQARGHRRRPNLVLVFWVIMCCCIFGYGFICAFVVLYIYIVFQYLAKSLTGKTSQKWYILNYLFCVGWGPVWPGAIPPYPFTSPPFTLVLCVFQSRYNVYHDESS